MDLSKVRNGCGASRVCFSAQAHGFGLVEAICVLAIGALALAGAAAWWSWHSQQMSLRSEVPTVTRAADLWWLSQYGYREQSEARCVAARFLPDDLETIECHAATGTLAASDAYGESPTATGDDGFLVSFRKDAQCKDAQVDIAQSHDLWVSGTGAPDVNGGPPTPPSVNEESGWGEVLAEDLAVRWTFVLRSGRTTGWLRHDGMASETGWPWSAPWSAGGRQQAFRDANWAQRGEGELDDETGGIIVGGANIRTCFGLDWN